MKNILVVLLFFSLSTFASLETADTFSVFTDHFGPQIIGSQKPTHHIKYTIKFWIRENPKDPWVYFWGAVEEGDVPTSFTGKTIALHDKAENTDWTFAIWFPKKIDNLQSMEQRFDIFEQKFKEGSTKPIKTQEVSEMTQIIEQAKKATYVYTTYLTGTQVKTEISQVWSPLP